MTLCSIFTNTVLSSNGFTTGRGSRHIINKLTCGATENARPENDGLENDRQNFSNFRPKSRGLENAGLENDGQIPKNCRVRKMQDWKMTDKILANSKRNHGVRKMQDWKMTCRANYRVIFSTY